MKVYLIETSSGSYDDYYTYIKTGFLDKSKADKYVEKYNKRLKDKRAQSDVCGVCQDGKYINVSDFIANCKYKLNIKDVGDINRNTIDNTIYFACKKSKYDSEAYDNHEATVKEIEIIE